MSHVPQRTEKDCLNCGTEVAGRYCQQCGQENVVPKETFWHMVTHFFYDITHFDSSFFHTVHHLVLKPGFLSREYMAGRRVRYLHPIRMYVFTSAVFFLLFFSIFKSKESLKSDANDPIDRVERNDAIRSIKSKLKKDKNNTILQNKLALLTDTTRVITKKDLAKMDSSYAFISFSGRHYFDLREYDSVQRTLPKEQRDGWLKRKLERRAVEINMRVREDPDEALKRFSEVMLHRIPYMLFVSLPLFALILKLVYFRRKQFYYSDHGVFTIHLYVFTFLLMMVVFGISTLADALNRDAGILIAALVVLLYFYLYKAMRSFYQQRRAKTILKFILVSFLSFLLMIFLLVIFFFLSAYTF